MPEKSSTQQLHERLAEIIQATESGDRLPSEPQLAQDLGVSRATLREAMRTFETQGLLRRRQGVGTFVTRPSLIIESGLEVLESIETQAERLGLPVSMGELEIDTCSAPKKAAKALQVDPDAELVCVARVILVEDRPVAYLVDTLPKKYINPEEMNMGFSGSVLDLLLTRGSPMLGSSRCEIASVAASSEVARALDIQRGDAVLAFEALLYTLDGEPIDYSLSYFLPGYFKFHVVRTVGTD
ncbi:MAG: GntR family transcriptional regulator [Anaerolineales bacterium]|nr:GntR family transcriptional regulator [Anaerolineales bacterium]